MTHLLTLKRSALSMLLALFLMTVIPVGFAADNDARALQILRTIDDMWRGESSHGEFSMKVVTKNYSRSMRLEAWSKGTEKTLVRIREPLKERGTATLKSGKHLYSYLPRTDRTIRLTSGMMMGSWMGSHLTNDDLVRESRMEEDFLVSISFEGMKDGRDIIEFELIPKPDAPVVWGKVMIQVLKQDYIPVVQRYYDEDMQLARTFSFSDIREMGGRPRPATMRVEPANEAGEYTEIHYHSLKLDIPIRDDFFSLASLKRR